MAQRVERNFGFKFEMFPNPEQEKELDKWLWVGKNFWNMLLEQQNSLSGPYRSLVDIYHEWVEDSKAGRKRNHRKNEYDAKGKLIIHPSWVGKLDKSNKYLSTSFQSSEIKLLRDAYPELEAVPFDIPNRELRHMEQALKRYSSGVSGWPTHKKFGKSVTIRKGYGANGSRCKAASERFGGPDYHALIDFGGCVGNVPFAESREIKGSWGDVTISKRADERWYFSVPTDHVKDKVSHAKKGSKYGVDVGYSNYRNGGDVNLLVFSDNRMFPPPHTDTKTIEDIRKNIKKIREIDIRISREQQSLSRKVPGSNQYKEQKKKIAKLYGKKADLANNYIWQTTALLVYTSEWGAETIFMENLIGMLKKEKGKALNNTFSSLAIARLLQTIEREFERVGGTCIRVNPAYTSRTCSRCGHEEKANRNGKEFECKACGFKANADHNAAMMVKKRGEEELKQITEKELGYQVRDSV